MTAKDIWKKASFPLFKTDSSAIGPKSKGLQAIKIKLMVATTT